MKISTWFYLTFGLAVGTLVALGSEAIEVVSEPTGKAVQGAIDVCAAKGGGVAYLPPGRYITGPLWLKDNVELRLEAGATVVLSPDQKDWPAGNRALINAKGAKHIAITGAASSTETLNGNTLPFEDRTRRSPKSRKSRVAPAWK